jgi:hydroxymethylbilane synthase
VVTGHQLTAERAFLLTLDGSCQTPIAGLAMLQDGRLWLRGEILRPDGSDMIKGEVRGPVGEAAAMGVELAKQLLVQAGAGFFDLGKT